MGCPAFLLPSHRTIQLITACLLLLAVLLCGGAVIRAIEQPHENRIRREQNITTGPVWTYANAIYFCTITVASVGYGDISPSTDGGRAFVIVYSIIGFGVVAWAVGMFADILIHSVETNTELVRRRTQAALSFFATHAMKGVNAVSTAAGAGTAVGLVTGAVDKGSRAVMEEFTTLWDKIGIQTRIMTTVLTFLVVLLSFARIFQHLEHWTYFHSVYYCFVTLTTIGYGDFSPKTREGRATAIVMVLFGLGILATILASIGQLVSKQTLNNVEKIRERMTKLSIANFRANWKKESCDSSKSGGVSGDKNGDIKLEEKANEKEESDQQQRSAELKMSADPLMPSPVEDLMHRFEELLQATSRRSEVTELADLAGNMFEKALEYRKILKKKQKQKSSSPTEGERTANDPVKQEAPIDV